VGAVARAHDDPPRNDVIAGDRDDRTRHREAGEARSLRDRLPSRRGDRRPDGSLPLARSSGGWARYGPCGLRLGGRLSRGLLRQHLCCQFLRARIDRFGRLTIERDALVMGKHGPAVEGCHFPGPERAERVLDRPAHCCGDLIGDTQRQRGPRSPGSGRGFFYAPCSPLPLCGHYSRAECARDRGLTLHTCKRSGFSSLPGKNARYNPLEPHRLIAPRAVGGID
jgi:hypothetical protein